MFLKGSPPEYKALVTKPYDEETYRFATDQIHQKAQRSVYGLAAPWIISALCVTLSVVLYLQKGCPRRLGTYETRFSTDLELGPAFELEQVRFWGGPRFHENGSVYRISNPEGPQYVGDPTPEIDSAWEALIGDRYFYLTEDEARSVWGDERFKFFYNPSNGYIAGVDVLHTLHCVNELRKLLNPGYYPLDKSYGREHLDHCIEQVRQMVQCFGDWTPLPVLWYEGIGRPFVDSDQMHTCRNFQKLRDFATERVKRYSPSPSHQAGKHHPVHS